MLQVRQIYFDKTQLSFNMAQTTDFVPYLNTESNYLLESGVIAKLYESGDYLGHEYYGVVSHRFFSKIKKSSYYVKHTIENDTEKPDVKKIAEKAREIEENKKKLEALAVKVDEFEELDNALARIIENEIEDLEGRTLSEEQTLILEQIKSEHEQKNYSQALEKILLLNYPQEN